MGWVLRAAGVACGLLVCSSALAQQPAPLALGASAGTRARIAFENDTDYSVFTQTLGANLHCMKVGVPAMSVPARQTAYNVPMESGSCAGSGLQTFVVGAPGGEHRLNVPFAIGGTTTLGQASIPFFSVSSQLTWNGSSYDGVWRVTCRWADCRTQNPVVAIQNKTAAGITLQLRLNASPGCPDAGQSNVLRFAPAGGAGGVEVRVCDSVQTWALSTGGSVIVRVENGRYDVDLINDQGNMLSKSYQDDGSITVTVASR